jgi:hypothetical protein
VPFDRIVRDVTYGTAMVFDLVAQWRSDGTIPDDQILDVHYRQLVAEPVTTMQRVYEWIGTPFDPAAEESVRAHLAGHRQHRHGVHEYSFEAMDLDLGEVRLLFAGYMARYDVEVEET